MQTVTYALLALILYSGAAAARGGHGSLSDGKTMLAVAFLVGVAAIGGAFRKR